MNKSVDDDDDENDTLDRRASNSQQCDHEHNTSDINLSTSTFSDDADDSDSSVSSSVTELNINRSLEEDVDAISLLKQIFPEDSPQVLRQLHHDHVQRRIQSKYPDGDASRLPSSNLGRRLFKQLETEANKISTESTAEWKPVELDEEFLRLPTSVAVRRKSAEKDEYRYEFIADLHDQILQEYLLEQQSRRASLDEPNVMQQDETHTTLWFEAEKQEIYLYTVVIHRHAEIGLGLTLSVARPPPSKREVIQVHGLASHPENPCLMTEIRPVDVLLGINGSLFYAPTTRNVVEAIRASPDPLVLHLLRSTSQPIITPVERQHSLLDATSSAPNDIDGNAFRQAKSPSQDDQSIATTSTLTTASSSWAPQQRPLHERPPPQSPIIHKIHPLARALCRKGLIRGLADEERVTQKLHQFHCRAHQWEEHQSLLVDSHTGTLLPRESLYSNEFSGMVNISSPPSTPSLDTTMGRSGSQSLLPSARSSYPGENLSSYTSIMPLYYIRKALCARIVNSFQEEKQNDSRVAFTIWVYDVEVAREWYAPIRYTRDFEDLYQACKTLAGNVEWDFPFQSTWFGRRRKRHAQEDTIRLEHFLRQVSAWIYTCEKLTPEATELAVHVQSFLGVEAAMAETPIDRASWQSMRQVLKMALQRYTYRVTLLTVLTSLTADFCEAMRQQSSDLPDIESHQIHSQLQTRARSFLTNIQNFLDSLVDLILEGCEEDLKAIAQHDYYSEVDLVSDEDSWERLVREAVREQVEIEVYVPLRSVVSRLLVHGWRHDDREVQFKMVELRKRKPSRVDIPWQSVAKILKEGVGMSTLPCVKLRAIVEAARELSRYYESADDFLPLFIYCVIQADLERPCALCILLQTLCDKMNRIGEIGYFLASFEAAIAHITDLDLTDQEAGCDGGSEKQHHKEGSSLSPDCFTDVSLGND